MNQPLVTAIVSTYNAERFIRGCLEDLIAQTIFNQIEVLIIDSGSEQGESAICHEYSKKYPQIRLVRTEREPLYAAWNRAIAMANGKYLTTSNTDDRHSPACLELLASTLENNAEIALVYAEQYISETENETFQECRERQARIQRVPDYKPEELMLRCITGSQPMWRKKLHNELGSFDTNYKIAADYDMWLRFAEKHRFARAPEVLGVFYSSPSTISGSNSKSILNKETLQIQMKRIQMDHWRSLPNIKKRLAKELFGRGYQRITHEGDGHAAEPFISAAIKLDPLNIRFRKTYAIRCLGEWFRKIFRPI